MDYRLGLIGYPVEHSLSPWIHESFMKQIAVKGSYTKYEIPLSDDFSKRIANIKKEGLQGFNVTVPYKQRIIPFLDKIDSIAGEIGAVNTVSFEDGLWVGYNTDGFGYLRSLEMEFPALMENTAIRILLVGAGGACRGIYHTFANAGFRNVDIANRTIEKAEDITKKHEKLNTKVFPLEEAAERTDQYDLIIQTSSVGMKPGIEEKIIQLDRLKKGAIVSDIVYQPIKTAFLKQAKESGAAIHFGHTMLLYQAQYAFEIWTGKRVPIDDMDKKLKLLLEG